MYHCISTVLQLKKKLQKNKKEKKIYRPLMDVGFLGSASGKESAS